MHMQIYTAYMTDGFYTSFGHTISQFRSIALLNVEGKIFFSILAKRLTTYLISNGYINTNCQKAGVPGFPGCMEHSAVIW